MEAHVQRAPQGHGNLRQVISTAPGAWQASTPQQLLQSWRVCVRIVPDSQHLCQEALQKTTAFA